MIYQKHLLESMSLQVELPMIVEIDNQGAVDLCGCGVCKKSLYKLK